MHTTIIFNTSFYVAVPLLPVWAQWMKKKVLPDIKEQVSYLNAEIFEIIEPDSGEYQTVSVQWRCSRRDEAQQLETLLDLYYSTIPSVFGDSVTCFNSMMEKTDL